MKKTLALILAMLVALSMFSVAAFAADDTVTITFVNGDETTVVEVPVGADVAVYAPENPVRENTEKTKYTFAGWTAEGSEEVYSAAQLPAAAENATYVATYAEEEIKEGQSLLKFIATIFERINLIFEYFAKIFGFDAE